MITLSFGALGKHCLLYIYITALYMISEFIYTSPYPNFHIIQMHAVAPYGLDMWDVAATFLIVTATMHMMIIVIMVARFLLDWLAIRKVTSGNVIPRSPEVLKDVALLL